MSDVVRVPMEELSPLIAECLKQGQEVLLTVTGNSMAPFLRHRRDQVVLRAVDGDALRPGDVCLYRRRNGQYILHRVVVRDDGVTHMALGDAQSTLSVDKGGRLRYTMLGDAQTDLEHGIGTDQILARAVAFHRKGKVWECDSAAYGRYVRRWHDLLPIRRWLMEIYRLPGRAHSCWKRLVGEKI